MTMSRLLQKRVSFDDRGNSQNQRSMITSSFYGDLLASSRLEEWEVISPMSRHVLSERSAEGSIANLPRRRSRSFNDFIENRSHKAPVMSGTAAASPSLGLEANEVGVCSMKSDGVDYGHDRGLANGQGKDVITEDVDMPFYISVLYGVINCTIVTPVVMSFGNIIYRDDAFVDYLPVLIKLTLFSGMVHQLCFSCFSSLQFAVGSVQDAGLIFLSRMAHDMVQYCRYNDYDDEALLATVTVGLSLGAAALGVGLIVIGKLGLASYVQMLPTCVIAGYLAYIGFFVGYSGLGIMAGTSSLTIDLLFEKFFFILPGIAGGALMYISVRKFRHVAILPLCITFLLLVFYVSLAIAGSSIQQAMENGWIRQTKREPPWYDSWDYLSVDKVIWSALPQLWVTWVGMLFVVALSSSLDVAAIELEMKKPLDYNKELGTVGVSNLVSGLTGGYTGSYIFSQTIFSLRIGIRSRIAGFAIAFFQLVIITLPFPVLSYVPNFFYGSLLSMICIDLVYEWLWEFRTKVTIAEYLIGISTFGIMLGFGVEYGILAGVVIYIICRRMKINVGEIKEIYIEENDATAEELGKGAATERVKTEETTQLVTGGNDPYTYTTF